MRNPPHGGRTTARTAVEEFDVADPSPDATEPSFRGRRARRPTGWVALAVALVLVGAVVAPPGGVSLGAVPRDKVGVLALDLAAPPVERWRVDLDRQGGSRQVVLLGSTLVTVGDGVQGLDPTTGATRWRLETGPGPCTVQQAVVCVDQPGADTAEVARVGPDGATTRTQVPGAVQAAAVEDDVVVLAVDDDGVVARRVAPDGGTVWTTPLAVGAADREDWVWASMAVLGDVLHLAAGESVALDLRDGTEVATDVLWTLVTGAGRVVVSQGEDGVLDASLVDADGVTRVEHLAALVDDDPTSVLGVRHGDGVSVTSDGTVLWQEPSRSAVARLAGVLVLAEQAGAVPRLVGHDPETGRALWDVRAPATPVVAGGSTLVVQDWVDGALHGIDVLTGDELWVHGSRVSVDSVAVLPDGIVLYDDAGLVRLSW